MSRRTKFDDLENSTHAWHLLEIFKVHSGDIRQLKVQSVADSPLRFLKPNVDLQETAGRALGSIT